VVEKLTELREGTVLAGKYRVDRVLGSGGMGMVVAAHHLGLDTRVAVKLLLPEMLEHKDVVARFAQEARASARITNEHVARVFDVGALENGAPYMVMEYLDGSDLGEWLRRDQRLPITQAVDFVLQACEGVAEAHGVGIVHRDLKPANLFCVQRSDGTHCIKVLDFGISKLSTGGAQSNFSMTATAAVMGTPYYMSPEQMESARDVDARTDIWSLGIILFELITGTRPFGGQTLPEVCFRIATHPAPRLRDQRPDAPSGLDAVLVRCLEKRRADRFPSIAELAAALAPFGSEQAASSAARSRRPSTATATALDVPHKTLSNPDSGELALRSSQSLSALGHTKRGGGTRTPAILGISVGAVGILVVASAIFVMTRPTAPVSAGRAPIAEQAPDAAVAPTAVLAPPADVRPSAVLEPAPTTAPVEMREEPHNATVKPRKASASQDPAKGRSGTPHPAANSLPQNADPPPGTNPFDERL
jgi:serine/threonine protein kinase